MVQKKRCFVIMPFGKQGTEEYSRNFKIYQLMIKPVVKDCGYESIRADELEHFGNITRDIIEHLYESDLVIADLSGKNANVFYELGVRHALSRIGTIPVISEGEILPFDIANYRALFYSSELDGPERFKKELGRRVKSFERVLEKRSDNPVHDILREKLIPPDIAKYVSLKKHEEKLKEVKSLSEVNEQLQRQYEEQLQENESLKKEIDKLQKQYEATKNQVQITAKDKKAVLNEKSELEKRIKELEEENRILEQTKPILVDLSTAKGFEAKNEKVITNSLNMKFLYISPGKFMMGSPEGEPGRDSEETLHDVMLSKGFYMQTTQVTVGQWRQFTEDTGYKSEAEIEDGSYVWKMDDWKKQKGVYWDIPGFEQTDNHPVTCVSWNDTQAFIEWLMKKEGNVYRLSTEAEWEYAARAGTTTPFAFGKCLSTDQANYNGDYPLEGCSKGEYRGKTIPVATLKSNAWGLYDMHGNVWEWCEDWYGDYKSGSVTDPRGPSKGSFRVVRGGSWNDDARDCRSAYRDGNAPDDRDGGLGFRLVRSLP